MSVSPGEALAFDPGLCRCCALEMKNCLRLDVEYDSSGKKEVYANMIMDCYGILLLYVNSEPTQRLICATCVGRLRDAFAFRQLVLQSEKAFIEIRKEHTKNIEYRGDSESALHGEVEVKSEPAECEKDPLDCGTVAADVADDADNAADAVDDAADAIDDATDAVDDAADAADDADEGAPLPKKPRLTIPNTKSEKKSRRTVKTVSKQKEGNAKDVPSRNYNDSLKKIIKLEENTADIDYYEVPILESGQLNSAKDKVREVTKINENINQPDPNTSKINDCNRTFNTKPAVTHGNMTRDVFQCGHCSYKSFTKESLTYHSRLHDPIRKFGCNICGFRFNTNYVLQSHKINHLNELGSSDRNEISNLETCNDGEVSIIQRPYYCKICDKKFSQKRNLVSHLTTHNAKEPFSCEQCQYKCLRKHDLEKHIRKHTGERPFHCKICDKTFVYKLSLMAHLSAHNGELPFNCEQCQYRCYKKNDLVKHIRIHTGERPYDCKICDKRFILKQHLTKHLKMHAKEELFRCEHCQFRCDRQRDLDEHAATHTGELWHYCEICEKKFSKKIDLITHIKVHGKKKAYRCVQCQFTCRNKRVLDKHNTTHTAQRPFHCETCDKKFINKNNLIAHLKLHSGEKPFSCDHCQYRCIRKRDLDLHMRRHTGERPFQCKICDKRFARKQSLVDHFKVHTKNKK